MRPGYCHRDSRWLRSLAFDDGPGRSGCRTRLDLPELASFARFSLPDSGISSAILAGLGSFVSRERRIAALFRRCARDRRTTPSADPGPIFFRLDPHRIVKDHCLHFSIVSYGTNFRKCKWMPKFPSPDSISGKRMDFPKDFLAVYGIASDEEVPSLVVVPCTS